MGLFDIFKGKTSSGDPQQELIDKIIRRYFNGSKEKLQAEVKDLLEITKYEISFEQMSALLLCSLGYHGLNAKWNEKIHDQLKLLCRGKLPEVELKWLFDYCDLHYIHPNPSKEFLLISEMAGRQIGMSAPHEVFSQKRADDLPQNCGPVIVDSWPLLDFAREHGKMQVGEFANKDTGDIFKACIFTKPDGTRTFVAFDAKMGELSPKLIAEMKNELQVVQLESGNYSLCKKRNNGWDDVVLATDEQYSSPKHVKNQATDAAKVIRKPSVKEEKGTNWLSLGDMKRETLEPYDSIRTSTEIKEWPISTSKGKKVRPPKETKPTSSHYLAMAIVIVIAVVLGISVYNSNLIHLKQDRMYFLVICCILAVVAWGYPYFETSINVDNDGCFEQGCIHPIIGVFSIVLFPLFIHYWLYKGIRICIVQFKKFFDSK